MYYHTFKDVEIIFARQFWRDKIKIRDAIRRRTPDQLAFEFQVFTFVSLSWRFFSSLCSKFFSGVFSLHQYNTAATKQTELLPFNSAAKSFIRGCQHTSTKFC
jgi:hypothetical protein